MHYKAIADAVDIPILIYNIPGRSAVDMSVQTMARLAAECPNIVGVKDATVDWRGPCHGAGDRARIYAIVGGGCDGRWHSRQWRRWLHLGDGECGAGPVRTHA